MNPKVNITLTHGSSYAWQNAKLWQDANRRAAIFAQFWSKVHRPDAKACWLWHGHVSDRGYGVFWIPLEAEACRVRAHRFVWIMVKGDIPDGMEVCHRCDVTRCVNPAHLFLGTRQDNHLDAVQKGRKKAWGIQKLNADQVREIRARVAAGELQRVIAADYGVARNTVSQIATGTTWGHVGPSPAVACVPGVAVARSAQLASAQSVR